MTWSGFVSVVWCFLNLRNLGIHGTSFEVSDQPITHLFLHLAYREIICLYRSIP